MPKASTSEADSDFPPPPSAPYLFSSSFSCSQLILFLFFSAKTPLLKSAWIGRLEICRLLLLCKADVEATDQLSLPPPYYYYCFYQSKLCLRKLILLLFFSQCTSLHWSAIEGSLEVVRLLVESKADVAARDRCFSPPPSHHLSLTICLAAMVVLYSNPPSTPDPDRPTLLHTCAASARLNDALPCPAPTYTHSVHLEAALLMLISSGSVSTGRDYSFSICSRRCHATRKFFFFFTRQGRASS
jgi:hypothetical protein